MIAHVVMATAGEYSDRTEWPLKGYFDQEAAKAEVERLTLAVHDLRARRPEWDEYEKRLLWDEELEALTGGRSDFGEGPTFFLYSVDIEGD